MKGNLDTRLFAGLDLIKFLDIETGFNIELLPGPNNRSCIFQPCYRTNIVGNCLLQRAY